MEFKEMENYIKETRSKFFFVFRENELKKLDEKLGIELEWKRVNVKTGLPADVEKHFIVIDFNKISFAELEKSDENIKLLKDKLGEFPDNKDCFCFDGLYDIDIPRIKKEEEIKK